MAKGTVNPSNYVNITDVRNGSKIFGILLQLDFALHGATLTSDTSGSMVYDWTVDFNINGAQTLPNPNTIGSSPLQTQVFHQDGGIFPIGSTSGGSSPNTHVVRLFVAIPKAWSQINDNDVIALRVQKSAMTTISLDVKIRAIYKEIFP